MTNSPKLSIEIIPRLLLYIIVVLVFVVSEIPGLSSLILAFSILLFCFLFVKATLVRKVILPKLLVLTYLGFCAYAALAMCWTPTANMDFTTILMLGSCLFTVVTVWMCIRSIDAVPTLKYAFITVLFINAAALLVEILTSFAGRLTGLAGNANTTALVLSIAMFFCLILVDNLWTKYLFVALGSFTAVFTGSRKFAISLLGIAIILMPQSFRYFFSSKNRMLLLFVIVIAASGVFMIYSGTVSEMFASSEQVSRVFSVFEGQTADESAEIRFGMINKGFQLWLDSPVIGNGLTSFSVLSGFGTYSHNNYIEILSCLGIIGLILFYSFDFLIIMRLLPKAQNGSATHQYLLVLMLVLLVYDLAAITYYARTEMLTKIFVAELSD